jgi:hypothetical protein
MATKKSNYRCVAESKTFDGRNYKLKSPKKGEMAAIANQKAKAARKAGKKARTVKVGKSNRKRVYTRG